MNRPASDISELHDLLELLAEEQAGEAEVARIEQLVLNSPAGMKSYLDFLALHGQLHWDAGATAAIPSSTPLQPASQPLRGRRLSPWVWTSTACGLALTIGIWSLSSRLDHARELNPIPSGASVAGSNQPGQNLPGSAGVAGHPQQETPRLPMDRRESPGLPFANHPGESVAGKSESGKAPKSVPLEIATGNTTSNSNGNVSPLNNDPARPVVATENPATQHAVPPHRSPALNAAAASQSVVDIINSELRHAWQQAEISPSPVADDATWLRRVTLDLIGRIPTLAETETFLADKHTDKRARQIDFLLESPDYPRYWSMVWTNLLIGRSAPAEIDRGALEKYLRLALAANRPWNTLVSELISAEGRADEVGPANFLLAHLNNEAVPATAVTAKLFLCEQVQCTQCHNHPFHSQKQAAFWELNSFFQQTAVEKLPAKNGRKGTLALVNRPASGPTFYETRTGLMIAAFPKYAGEEVDSGSAVNRRQELARLMVDRDSKQLAAGFINRAWSHFFGYAFTRQVDDMGPHNPPSHPELLEALGARFVESGFDIKQLHRNLCLSDIYQRSSQFGPRNQRDDPATGDVPLFSRMYVKPLAAEQIYDSLLIAGGSPQDWSDLEKLRQSWMQQYVVSMQTEENDEANTFDGTIVQALTLMNGPLVQRAISGAPGTVLADVLRKRPSETERIQKLCLAALSRTPTEKELARFRKSLHFAKGTRPVGNDGFEDLYWALLNSNEFVLNR